MLKEIAHCIWGQVSINALIQRYPQGGVQKSQIGIQGSVNEPKPIFLKTCITY